MQSKVRQALVDKFLSALQEDTIPWHRCWNTARPRSLQTGREYRGINNLSLSYIAVEKDPNELFMAIKDADKITDYLIEHGKVLQLGMVASPYQDQHPSKARCLEDDTEWEP